MARRLFFRFFFVFSALLLLGMLNASLAVAGTDYSVLVEAVDFGTVATGVLGVAAALITVYITIKGVRLMMGFVKGEGGGASGGSSGGSDGWGEWSRSDDVDDDTGQTNSYETRTRRKPGGGIEFEHRSV